MTTVDARLRAHHLLCLLAFSGEGYSPAFVARFQELAAIYRDPERTIEVRDRPDDACAACPHLSETMGCVSPQDGPESEVRRLDHAVLEMLGLAPGIHRTGDIHRRLASVENTDLHRACALCSWYGQTDCQRIIRQWLELR